MSTREQKLHPLPFCLNMQPLCEYEFVGLRQSQILKKLGRKYGPAEIIKGKFISDKSYRWLDNGIEILLRSDWQNYRTRLSYIDQTAMLDRSAFPQSMRLQLDELECINPPGEHGVERAEGQVEGLVRGVGRGG